MRALTAALAASVWVSAASGAQGTLDSGPWGGDVTVEYSPTRYLGRVRAITSFQEVGWLSVACTSDEADFTPCTAHLYGAFATPPAVARTIVLSIFKDGEQIAVQSFDRRNVSMIGEDRVSLNWQMNAGSAGALWLVLAEGGPIAFQFADANGLGRPISYATYTYELPAFPQRAIDIVQTMRTSDARPRVWAEDILGRCAVAMRGQEGVVRAQLSGEQFQHVSC
jgi:hypothetical protein